MTRSKGRKKVSSGREVVQRPIELLRDLEELDMTLKDVESPHYPKEEFKLQLEFVRSAERRRSELVRVIAAELVTEYERIRHRYGGKVVVQVIDEFCGGCYARLPSELAERCRGEVLTCPNCGRFLYRPAQGRSL